MDAELLKKVREVMQRARVDSAPTATPVAIEKQDPVVSAQAVLAEHDEAEVIQIMEVWRRVFGFSEFCEHIAMSLRDIRRWQAEGPACHGETIRPRKRGTIVADVLKVFRGAR